MKHLFITVLLILLLATPVAGFSGWGGSGWGGSGWGEEEVEEPEGVTPEEEPEEEVEEIIKEVEEEPVEEEPPAPDYGLTAPDTAQFLVDNGYAPSGFNSGWVEPAAVVYAPEPEVTIEPEVEPEILAEPIVITEKVIVYEPVYIEKEPTDNMQWWVEMNAPVEENVEDEPVVARVKGISTPQTGGCNMFWLGLLAVICSVILAAKIEGRGE